MSRGQTFYEALKDSVYELDGCFAYLLSMPDVIGSAKDMFAIKSIVVANVGGDTAMATEEQAIRAVYTERARRHPPPRPALRVRVGALGPGPAGDRMTAVSTEPVVLDADDGHRLNRRMRDLVDAGTREITVLNPRSRHNLGVGQHGPCTIRFAGSVGYYCGGLNNGCDIVIERSAGWGPARR